VKEVLATIQLSMEPAPGTGRLLFAGEVLTVRVWVDPPGGLPSRARAFLRTDLNRASEKRRQVISRVEKGAPFILAGWHDLPLEPRGEGVFETSVIAFQPGYYELKGFVEIDNELIWVKGPNASVTIHPLRWRSGNILYCAFPRQFGVYRHLTTARPVYETPAVQELDREGYTVIPPSGGFRDLAEVVPFLIQELGIRILHLLPVQEVPTVYGRMGRYGSPYAATDLTTINHAYCVFDERATPAEQFEAFCAQVHAWGGEVFLDLAINHLGWSTELLNTHPDWFVRDETGRFISPGAWGTIWRDLVELDFEHRDLWEYLAQGFLLWCQRGVDGFRCDAGYMVPLPVWEYITARVHEVFPDTVFLLEGLGGPWEATEALLRQGGMQWAYSEIFQNWTVDALVPYLQHQNRCSTQYGILANYAETHDNVRLAIQGETFTRMRLALSALASFAGCFGFTSGVEWLATEKIDVHGSSGLRWGRSPNIVPWVQKLTQLIRQHPIFHGVSPLQAFATSHPEVLALRRCRPPDEELLVVANVNSRQGAGPATLPPGWAGDRPWPVGTYQCLLSGRQVVWGQEGPRGLYLGPGEVLCFDRCRPRGLRPEEPLQARAQQEEEELRLRCLLAELWGDTFDLTGFPELLQAVRNRGLRALLAAASRLGAGKGWETGRANAAELAQAVAGVTEADSFLGVSAWDCSRADRIHVMEASQFLYFHEAMPFRVRLEGPQGPHNLRVFRDFGDKDYVAYARVPEGHYQIDVSRLDRPAQREEEARWVSTRGYLWSLGATPQPLSLQLMGREVQPDHQFLLTNDRGSYCLLPVAPGTVYSKYQALLAANLHPSLPDERVVLVKRLRCWVETRLYGYPLETAYLQHFRRFPWPTWEFVYDLPSGRLELTQEIRFDPDDQRVTVTFRWSPCGEDCRIGLLVRPDVEFRSHHSETKAFTLNEPEFARAYVPLPQASGFCRTLGEDLEMVARSAAGTYTPAPEWQYAISHPHEATRGQEASGDAFSPGYFERPLDPAGGTFVLEFLVRRKGAEGREGKRPEGEGRKAQEGGSRPPAPSLLAPPSPASWVEVLRIAARQFLVRRGDLTTVLAGYPWFLDWGRDTFIAARGYLAEGWVEEVLGLLLAFARLERDGTLPNALSAGQDRDRDTSDAPLWFVNCMAELAAQMGWRELVQAAERRGVDLRRTLQSICDGYCRGLPNGVVCDAETGLVYSPAHFTWMDTNFPAATPRQGYPVEIQALWVRALRFAAEALGREDYLALADRVAAALSQFFWLEEEGYLADGLMAESPPAPWTSRSERRPGQSPQGAEGCPSPLLPDTALRPNQLYVVTFGLIDQERARSVVERTAEHLLVPAGLRSLANLPLSRPFYTKAAPAPPGVDVLRPYRGRYEGPEDTSRKLAYHNGTAWAHLLPLWVEALLQAFPEDPRAERLGEALLRTYEAELRRGCLGQISEIFDGDAPHLPRGCCAQAWAVTEALRVQALLEKKRHGE
jgi:starch synthase (maltosyl-transferring)